MEAGVGIGVQQSASPPVDHHVPVISIRNQKVEKAANILNIATSSSNDVSGAVFLPSEPKATGCIMDIEKTFKLNDLKQDGSITAIRIEGSKNSIDQRIENLIKELKIINVNLSILEKNQSEILWNKIISRG